MSLNATTASSSYTMSLGLWRPTMRQNRQSFTEPPKSAAIIRRSQKRLDEKEYPDGHLPQVQAAHSQERQPREARIRLASQDLPGPARRPLRKDRLLEIRALPPAGPACPRAGPRQEL